MASVGRHRAAKTDEPMLPAQVTQNLISRYMDKNREFYAEEFLLAIIG